MSKRNGITALVLIAWACVAGDPKVANEAPPAGGGPDAVWSDPTPSGIRVAAMPAAGTLQPGENRVVIAVSDPTVAPLSVDLVAPRMPMHGIVRYGTERLGHQWVARLVVPMPGEWLLYVNFDEGDDTAVIPFTVRSDPSAAGAPHEHAH